MNATQSTTHPPLRLYMDAVQKASPRLYTNDTFEGGETSFFEPDPSLPVSNKKLTPQQLGNNSNGAGVSSSKVNVAMTL